MADADAADGEQDLEAPVEDLADEHTALLHFGKYHEGRRALPREQWTFKEKANYYIDRVFLWFLFIIFLVLLGEAGYKIFYVTNVRMIAAFVSELVGLVHDWLFAQERQEELFEL